MQFIDISNRFRIASQQNIDIETINNLCARTPPSILTILIYIIQT
jgi:hypothetical protein